MKRFIQLCTLFLVILSNFTMIKASDSLLVDQANLLTSSEESILIQELDALSTQYDVSIVIVTIDDLNGQSSLSYADDYYDYHQYKDDGVLFLLSIGDREYAISTTGSCIQAFDDSRLIRIEDAIIDDLSYGNYYRAFEKFIDLSEGYLYSSETVYDNPSYSYGTGYEEQSYSYGTGIAVSLGVGLVIALIVTTIMKSQLKTIKRQYNAQSYVTNQQLIGHQDIYLYRHVSRQRKPEPKSGGSSIHVSSSGRSHGGRSGRF